MANALEIQQNLTLANSHHGGIKQLDIVKIGIQVLLIPNNYLHQCSASVGLSEEFSPGGAQIENYDFLHKDLWLISLFCVYPDETVGQYVEVSSRLVSVFLSIQEHNSIRI